MTLAFLAMYLLCKFDEASFNISSLGHLSDFQTITYGGHFVFQNEAKILHRHVFIAINILRKFGEDIFLNK